MRKVILVHRYIAKDTNLNMKSHMRNSYKIRFLSVSLWRQKRFYTICKHENKICSSYFVLLWSSSFKCSYALLGLEIPFSFHTFYIVSFPSHFAALPAARQSHSDTYLFFNFSAACGFVYDFLNRYNLLVLLFAFLVLNMHSANVH